MKNRSAAAKALSDHRYRQRIVRPKKGNKAYNRKKVKNDKEIL